MRTALTYRFTMWAVVCAAAAVLGQLVMWWWAGGSYIGGDERSFQQIALQAWSAALQILIWLTVVFAGGAIATRVVAEARGWGEADDAEDDPYGDDPFGGEPVLGDTR
ncbi:MAG: hypothetical protein LCI03_08525 [Actinobacteria bacterium]|jgi:hypothetical protein|nr:hypothetical protein [Actinomycetota bacterium]